MPCHRTTPDQSYFDSVSTQLELSVGRSCAGVVSNAESNASSGVSPGLNTVDTGLKAGMALQGVVEQGLESAYLPALAQLGLKGMACLPVSKQLDPVLGIDCYVMVPGGPLPNPYIGLLINPLKFKIPHNRRQRQAKKEAFHGQTGVGGMLLFAISGETGRKIGASAPRWFTHCPLRLPRRRFRNGDGREGWLPTTRCCA